MKVNILIIILCLVRMIGEAQDTLSTYKVKRPRSSIAIELEKLNVLYVGIDNPIKIGDPNKRNLVLELKGGRIEQREYGYVAKVFYGTKSAVLNIYEKHKDGKNELIDTRTYKVKGSGLLIAKVAGMQGGKIFTKDLAQAAIVDVVVDGAEFETDMKVTSFDMTRSGKGRDPIEVHSDSGFLTDEMRRVIMNSRPGDYIYFENIRAKGPDGPEVTLNALKFVIM